MNRLRTLSSDTIWLIVISLLLLALGIFAAWIQQPPLPSLSTYNYQNRGSAALWHWLDENGIEVERNATQFFAVPESASVAFLLRPSQPLEPAHLAALEKWVWEGGTLILVGDNLLSATTMGQLGVDLNLSAPIFNDISLDGQRLNQQSPLLNDGRVQVVDIDEAEAFLARDRADYVTLLAIEDKPLFMLGAHGNGRFIFSSTPYPFTNEGIDKADNAQFIASLLSLAQRDGTVWFDEWHHGFFQNGNEIRGFMMWLQRTPAGRAILFAFALGFFALLLAGRNFGRPVPLPSSLQKRQAVEHVEAVGSLHRRAGHVNDTLQQYRIEIKRALGQRYRVDSALNDDIFVREIGRFAPDLDQSELSRLLNDLQAHRKEDDAFVELAEKAGRIIESI